MDKSQLELRVRELAEGHGPWTYDVPLPHGVWTSGNQGVPHTRVKRVVQVISDLVQKPLSQCRVLDLGCLEGQFSVELAKHGASAVGVEIREDNIVKAHFVKEALELHNVDFRQDDVREVTENKYGRFDAIICSGILYHLTGKDAADLIHSMFSMVSKVAVIDTHISLSGQTPFEYRGQRYWGHDVREHGNRDTAEMKAKKLWASADNETSYWFTRPSLVNLLNDAGFSSVYECFTPAHINYGKHGIEAVDRCTLVAIKAPRIALETSPAANWINERWPEGTLSYSQPISTIKERAKKVVKSIIGR